MKRRGDLIADNKDFSLFDEIYHPDYKAVDPMTGITVNLEDDKAQIIAVDEEDYSWTLRTVYETDDFLQVHRYVRINKESSDPIYYNVFMLTKTER